MKIVVLHSFYGCDSGCCGHVIEVDGKRKGKFFFGHPYKEDNKQFAKDLIFAELGPEHVEDLDWENCRVSED